MTEDERVMYSALIAVRNTDATLRWTRTQIFFLIHSGALSLVIVQTKIKFGDWLHMGICVAGLLLAVLWFWLTLVIQKFIEYWDDRLEELEKISPRPRVRVFGGRSYWNAMRGYRVHTILKSLVAIFITVWLALLTLSILTALLYIKP